MNADEATIAALTIPPPMDTDACYAALAARDARFDGVFFVGVASTHIYCRIGVCPARSPKRENCAFYPSAARAEKAGYRPCLRCRPELAPGRASVDSTNRLAARISTLIEDGALSSHAGGAALLAQNVGVSERHLRRVIEAAWGVSPVELAQTHRLLLAKRLLTDTDLPVTTIAFASGFSSVRRFNALFLERYRMNPSALRKTANDHTTTAAHPISVETPYLPPYDWNMLSTFLAGRAMLGTEAVTDAGEYVRALRVGQTSGWISVAPHPSRDALVLTLAADLVPRLLTIRAAARRVFDLAMEPDSVANVLGKLVKPDDKGLRLPGAFDGYEMTVRAILGQQITVKAATTLAGRFSTRFGEPIETPFAAVTRLSPRAEVVAQATEEELIALGIMRARAKSILALSRAVADGTVDFADTKNAAQTGEKLLQLPGIGSWTAQYVLMRAFSWPDAFPHTDLGIYKALNVTNPRRVLEIAEAWRPYRAYATLHLWKSLEPTPPLVEPDTGINADTSE